jgi:phage head maturation protease
MSPQSGPAGNSAPRSATWKTSPRRRHRRPARRPSGRLIHTRQYTSSLALRDDGDGRTLVGPLLPWDVEARVVDRGRLVVETFERGALAGTDPAKAVLTATHPRDAGTLPIGRTLTIEDRADAAWGEWLVSDTALGNEVLALARDQVPLGLSVGFMEVPGGSRWTGDRRVTRTGPSSTMLRWSESRPTRGPASWRPNQRLGRAPTPVLLTLLRRHG